MLLVLVIASGISPRDGLYIAERVIITYAKGAKTEIAVLYRAPRNIFQEVLNMSHMRFILLTATAAVFIAGDSTRLFAQGLIMQKALPLEMAQTMAQGAVDRCRSDGFHVSVTVIDGSGLLKVFMRD